MIDHVQKLIDEWQASADPRIAFSHVQVEPVREGLALSGEVLDSGARFSLLDHLARRLPSENILDRITVLMDSAPTAVVHRSVASVRRGPTEKSDLLTQVLFGEPVSILKTEGEWTFVRVSGDGYLGWMPGHALVVGAFTAPTHTVRAPIAAAYGESDSLVVEGQVPFGAGVEVVDRNGEVMAFSVPGAGCWWTSAENLAPLEARPAATPAGLQEALHLAARFVGVPYLWGGRSPFGFDCSGLAQVVSGYCGVRLPRDADMQFAAGESVEGDAKPGDLLFFGRPGYTAAGVERKGGVNHVALSLGGDEFLHASSAVWGVARGSLDPASPRYYPELAARFLGTRRYRCE